MAMEVLEITTTNSVQTMEFHDGNVVTEAALAASAAASVSAAAAAGSASIATNAALLVQRYLEIIQQQCDLQA